LGVSVISRFGGTGCKFSCIHYTIEAVFDAFILDIQNLPSFHCLTNPCLLLNRMVLKSAFLPVETSFTTGCTTIGIIR